MYYGSGSVPRIASSSRRTLQRRMSDTLCAYSRWQHFYALNYVMAAILKVYVKSKISLSEEQSCKISSWSVLKRRSLRHFWRGRQTRRRTTTRCPFKNTNLSQSASNSAGCVDLRAYYNIANRLRFDFDSTTVGRKMNMFIFSPSREA